MKLEPGTKVRVPKGTAYLETFPTPPVDRITSGVSLELELRKTEEEFVGIIREVPGVSGTVVATEDRHYVIFSLCVDNLEPL